MGHGVYVSNDNVDFIIYWHKDDDKQRWTLNVAKRKGKKFDAKFGSLLMSSSQRKKWFEKMFRTGSYVTL